jgi:hypothetical protein
MEATSRTILEDKGRQDAAGRTVVRDAVEALRGANGRRNPLTNNFDRPWTPEELAILEANASLSIDELLSLLPGRSIKAIRVKRSKVSFRSPPWTGDELATLRKNRKLTTKQLTAVLPGRSAKSINNKRERMGLQLNQWTGEELMSLRRLAPLHFPQTVANEIGRTVTMVKAMAETLGIKFRPNKPLRRTGNEVLDAIIQRCVEDDISLRALDREAGTKTYFALDIFNKRRQAMNPNLVNVAKAVTFFGGRGLLFGKDGKITIDWNDE